MESNPGNSSNSLGGSGSGVSFGVFADKSPPPPPKVTKPWLVGATAAAAPGEPQLQGLPAAVGRSPSRRADGSRADGGRADGSRADGGRADGSRADGSRAAGGGGPAQHALFRPLDLALDLSVLHLAPSGGGADDFSVSMPQPSPRFQTASTIAALHQRPAAAAAAGKDAPGAAPGHAGAKGSFKGFKIPAAARAQLGSSNNSDRSNSGGSSSGGSSSSNSGGNNNGGGRPAGAAAPFARALSDRTNSPPGA
jgi:hypothetical protein